MAGIAKAEEALTMSATAAAHCTQAGAAERDRVWLEALVENYDRALDANSSPRCSDGLMRAAREHLSRTPSAGLFTRPRAGASAYSRVPEHGAAAPHC